MWPQTWDIRSSHYSFHGHYLRHSAEKSHFMKWFQKKKNNWIHWRTFLVWIIQCKLTQKKRMLHWTIYTVKLRYDAWKFKCNAHPNSTAHMPANMWKARQDVIHYRIAGPWIQSKNFSGRPNRKKRISKNKKKRKKKNNPRVVTIELLSSSKSTFEIWQIQCTIWNWTSDRFQFPTGRLEAVCTNRLMVTLLIQNPPGFGPAWVREIKFWIVFKSRHQVWENSVWNWGCFFFARKTIVPFPEIKLWILFRSSFFVFRFSFSIAFQRDSWRSWRTTENEKRETRNEKEKEKEKQEWP
jgi:hypothetical protein